LLYFKKASKRLLNLIQTGGEKLLHDNILDKLPHRGRGMCLADTAGLLDKIAEDKCFQVYSRSAQGEFNTVRGFVGDMLANKSPDCKRSCASPFIQTVIDRLAYFFVHSLADSSDLSTEPLYGKDALMRKFADIQDIVNTDQPVNAEMFKPFHQGAFLVDSKTLAQVECWQKGTKRSATDVVSIAIAHDEPASKKGKPSPGTEAKEKAKQKTAREDAMSFFD